MLTKELIKMWMLADGGGILYDPDNEDIFTGYINFTPKMAEEFLKNNTKNRKMGFANQIPALIESITNGYWDPNVSKINIAADDTISDGQNRLCACVKAGKTIRCLVTYGLASEAQRKTDRRGRRTLSNDFAIEKVTNGHHKAALTKVFYLKDELGVDIKTILNHGSAYASLSDVHMYDYFMRNKEEITDAQKRVAQVYVSIRDLDVKQSVLNVVVPAFDRISREDAVCFWKRLKEGVAYCENDPIILLRKRLVENARNNVNKMPNTVICALIIKAWNFYMRGETPKFLKYSSGGANPELFPKIYDPNKEK